MLVTKDYNDEEVNREEKQLGDVFLRSILVKCEVNEEFILQVSFTVPMLSLLYSYSNFRNLDRSSQTYE